MWIKILRRVLAVLAAIAAVPYTYEMVIFWQFGIYSVAVWLLIGLIGCVSFIALVINSELHDR